MNLLRPTAWLQPKDTIRVLAQGGQLDNLANFKGLTALAVQHFPPLPSLRQWLGKLSSLYKSVAVQRKTLATAKKSCTFSFWFYIAFGLFSLKPHFQSLDLQAMRMALAHKQRIAFSQQLGAAAHCSHPLHDVGGSIALPRITWIFFQNRSVFLSHLPFGLGGFSSNQSGQISTDLLHQSSVFLLSTLLG